MWIRVVFGAFQLVVCMESVGVVWRLRRGLLARIKWSDPGVGWLEGARGNCGGV
jgi:hypothetical protein